MKAFDYAIATTREAALAALADGWTAKAGGIDLVDRLKERTEPSEKIVGIHRISELRGIHEAGEGIAIGALTTLRDLETSDLLKKKFPALVHAASDAATPQVRALATVGGNLCQRPRCWYFRSKDYPCLKKGGSTCYAVDGENQFHSLFNQGNCHIVHPSNLAPILIASRAEITVERHGGEQQTIPAGSFFVAPAKRMDSENVLEEGDLVTWVRIPKIPEKSAYVEYRQKQSFDWPLASCAVAYLDFRWNVVLGAVAPIPWQATYAERVLKEDASISPELAEKAADAELAIASPMSGNAWRLQHLRAAVRNALLIADGRDTG